MAKFRLFENQRARMVGYDDWWTTLEAAKEAAMYVLARDPYTVSICIYMDELFCGEMYQSPSDNPQNNGSRWASSSLIKETVSFWNTSKGGFMQE